MIDDDLLEVLFPAVTSQLSNYSGEFEARLMFQLKARSRLELLESTTSTFFRASATFARRNFGIDLQRHLDGIDLYVVPSPRYRIQALVHRDRPTIVIDQGLVALLSFRVETMHFTALARELANSAQTQPLDDKHPVMVFESLHLGLVYAYLDQPFQLPSLTGTMPAWMLARTVPGTVAVTTFLLLHEIAHVRLGHLARNPVLWGDGFDNALASLRAQEHEADIHATRLALTSGDPSGLLWGGGVFLMVHGMHEILMHIDRLTHPDAVIRLRNIAKVPGVGEGDRDFVEQLASQLVAERAARVNSPSISHAIAILLHGSSVRDAAKLLIEFYTEMGHRLPEHPW